MTRWLTAVALAALVASSGVAAPPDAKGKGMMGKGMGKGARAAPVKVEKLACKLGTEDRHARIAIELANDKVREFAYYSIWKPRTCSVHVTRGDAYSKWTDLERVTTVTLAEEKGAVLIDHAPGTYKFIFREVDRMRYCGAEGKVSGSLTLYRGKAACELDAVLDDDPTKLPPEPEKKELAFPEPSPEKSPDLPKGPAPEAKDLPKGPAPESKDPPTGPAPESK